MLEQYDFGTLSIVTEIHVSEDHRILIMRVMPAPWADCLQTIFDLCVVFLASSEPKAYYT